MCSLSWSGSASRLPGSHGTACKPSGNAAERLRLDALRVEQERRREEDRIRLTAGAKDAYPILERARASLNPTEYLATSEAAVWQAEHRQAFNYANRPELAGYLPEPEAANFRTWSRELRDLPHTLTELNEQFIAKRMEEDHDSFNRVEEYRLTKNQRRAIITNEDTTLVIAGAGTGKTSTIIGKVDYLLRHQLAVPEDILVLAFNRKASEQLKDERLPAIRGAQDVHVSTFHAFGLRVIGESDGRRPTLSPLAEDARQFKTFIRSQLREMLAHRVSQHLLINLLSRHLDEERSEDASKTGDQRIRDEKAAGLRAINGKKLKSREEVQIANWLTLNGIRWEYERPYPFHQADQHHRQYQPDFYLPDYDLYIEHFGLNERGETAPHIDTDAYKRTMEWKRELHRQHRTRLVETFSAFKTQGGLVENLERLLGQSGVVIQPLTQADIDAITAESNRPFSDFIDLVAQFLSLHKSNGDDRASADARARSERDHVFLRVFWPILDAYTAELAADNHIDSNDMINRARECIRSGRYRRRFTYILVDEFQDISDNRLGLLRDLRALSPHGRLFGVGDDWQSIYRFGGSDVNIVPALSRRQGTRRVDLDIAFRYPQELLDATSRFIMANDRQLKKNLAAHQGFAGEPPLFVLLEARGTHESTLDTILSDIIEHADGKPLKVFMLGRYKFSKPELIGDLEKRGKRHGLEVTFSTAHSAKGKEADYVIVLGLEAGEYGFPSNIADDPVMKMVLSEEERFPYAEERRLFYVAMTRARRRVYLIAPQDNPSTFVHDDLLADAFKPWVETIGEVSVRHRCPRCQGDTIRRTIAQYGTFWACSHYPICTGKLDSCPWCRTGGLVARGNGGRTGKYICADCGREAEACPKCASGYLRERTGKYGVFQGCSQWKQDGTGCGFTRNVPSSANA